MNLFVTGGLSFEGPFSAAIGLNCLHEIHARKKISKVIHQGKSGASLLGNFWANSHGLKTHNCVPYWGSRTSQLEIDQQACKIIEDHAPDLTLILPGCEDQATIERTASSNSLLFIAWPGTRTRFVSDLDVCLFCPSLHEFLNS